MKRSWIYFSLLPSAFSLGFSQPFPARITRVELVPEFDVVLVFFPTEKNFASADDRREIQEAAFDVLDEDLPLLKFPEHFAHGGQSPDPAIDLLAADVASAFHNRAQVLFVFFQLIAQAVEVLQPLPDLRQERAR